MTKLSIRGHEIYLTNEIKEYAQKKLDKLGKKYKTIIAIDLSLEEDHNKMEDTAAVAGATIQIAGKDINGRATARTIYAAIGQLRQR